MDYEITEELKKKIKKKYPELYKKLESDEFQIDMASVVDIHNDNYVSIIDRKKNERLKLKFGFSKENSKIRDVEIFEPTGA